MFCIFNSLKALFSLEHTWHASVPYSIYFVDGERLSKDDVVSHDLSEDDSCPSQHSLSIPRLSRTKVLNFWAPISQEKCTKIL